MGRLLEETSCCSTTTPLRGSSSPLRVHTRTHTPSLPVSFGVSADHDSALAFSPCWLRYWLCQTFFSVDLYPHPLPPASLYQPSAPRDAGFALRCHRDTGTVHFCQAGGDGIGRAEAATATEAAVAGGRAYLLTIGSVQQSAAA